MKNKNQVTFPLVLLLLFIPLGLLSTTQIEKVTRFMDLRDSRSKVDSINGFISETYRKDPWIALKYGRVAYDIARELNYTTGQKDALYTLSNIYKIRSKLDSAAFFTNLYLDLARTSGDSLALAKGYFQMGNLVRRQIGSDTAEIYYLRAKNLFEKLDNEYGQISVYNALGIVYKNKTWYDEAVKYYQEVLNLSEELNYDDGLASALINLGKIYTLMGVDSLAQQDFRKSIPYNIKTGNLHNLALAYNNLGIVRMKMGNYDSAMYFFEKSILLEKQLDNVIGINNLYINQGTLYVELSEFKKALIKFDLALKAFSNIQYPRGLITAMYSKAHALSALGRNMAVISLLDSALRLAKAPEYIDLRRDIYNEYYNHYLNRKDYSRAVEFQRKYYRTKDSIWNVEKEKNVSELRIKFEREKDQARILALTNENLEKDLKIRKRTNQRNIYIFSSGGIILLALFTLIFYRAKSRNDNYIAMQKIRQLEKDKKLISAQFLLEGQEEERKRIAKELHDGIGMLLSTAKMQFTSIDGITPDSRPKINNATRLLELAATEVRKITHNMMPGLLTRYGFFEAIDDLIEQINEGGTIQAEMNIEGEHQRFPENKEFMLYRIVQEMINNTIKHSGATKLRLIIKIDDGRLDLEYEDNGKGFEVAEKMNKKSIGLKSIKSRSDYLGGKLKLISTPGGGTRYTLSVLIKQT